MFNEYEKYFTQESDHSDLHERIFSFIDICKLFSLLSDFYFVIYTVELQWLDPDGSFTLPGRSMFLGPYDPIYETSGVKFQHLCFNVVIYTFYF